MARLSLDLRVWTDPRVRRLARATSMSMRETVGTLCAVWSVCYEAKSPAIDAIDVDVAAERDGFAEIMVLAGLAANIGGAAPGGEAVRVRVAGVEERIAYLLAQAERGRAGGQARAKRSLTKRSSVRSNLSTAPDIAPDTASATEPPLPPLQGGTSDASKSKLSRKRKRDPLTPTPQEAASVAAVLSKLSVWTQVTYESPAHAQLILARLREGHTEPDLRMVLGYCATAKAEGGKGWADDEGMREYLRPATLFGPKTIHRYVDEAKSWYRKHYPNKPLIQTEVTQ